MLISITLRNRVPIKLIMRSQEIIAGIGIGFCNVLRVIQEVVNLCRTRGRISSGNRLGKRAKASRKRSMASKNDKSRRQVRSTNTCIFTCKRSVLCCQKAKAHPCFAELMWGHQPHRYLRHTSVRPCAAPLQGVPRAAQATCPVPVNVL